MVVKEEGTEGTGDEGDGENGFNKRHGETETNGIGMHGDDRAAKSSLRTSDCRRSIGSVRSTLVP